MASRRSVVAVAVLVGSVVSTLMQNFLNVSLPSIAVEIGSFSLYSWVVGAYMIASTVTIPLFGRMADKIGTRRIYLLGMLLYLVGTVCLAGSQASWQIVLSRICQGIGTGAIVPAGLGAVGRVFDANTRGRVIGAFGAVQVIVSLLATVLGGWLAGAAGWRVAVLVVVPVAAIAMVTATALPGVRSVTPGEVGGGSASGLLRNRSLMGLAAMAALLASLTYGVSAYLPLLAQAGYGTGPAEIGWVLLPALIGAGAGSLVGGYRSTRPSTLEMAWVCALSGLALSLVPGLAFAAGGGALVGFGVGAGLPVLLVGTEKQADASAISMASGLIQLGRNVGGALGVPLFGVGLQLTQDRLLAARSAYLVMLLVAVLGVVVTLWMLRGGRARTESESFGADRSPFVGPG